MHGIAKELVKKITESLFNFAGAGMFEDACEKEQEGTSHAQDQAAQVGSDSVVSFSAAPLPPSTGKEKNEAHPPIRTVRGLTSPNQRRRERKFSSIRIRFRPVTNL